MEKTWIMLLSVFLVIMMPNVFAEPRQAELVVTELRLIPEHPQAGDKIEIIGSVYNAGTIETNYYASVVTGAFFVDGELRKIVEIGNVKIGINNKVDISSGAFLDTEYGKHEITFVVDYHDSISDSADNTQNNKITKIFDIEPVKKSEIYFSITPQYVIPQKDLTFTVSGSLIDPVTNEALTNQEVNLKINEIENTLTTDKSGEFRLSKAIAFEREGAIINATFNGKFPYLGSTYEEPVHSLPEKTRAALITKIQDPQGKYNFQNLPSLVVVYEDSYEKIFAKISTRDASKLLDNNTTWIEVQPEHSYLEEIYVDGRFFFSSSWKKITHDEVAEEKFYYPAPAQIKFNVLTQEGMPVADAIVTNWIYSSKTNHEGDTEWIDVLPTRSEKEPYVAIVDNNGKISKSEPFVISTDERKIIKIITNESESTIPLWVKENTVKWASDQTSVDDFITGLEYLVEQKIIPSSLHIKGDEIQIPDWIKTPLTWWSEEKISDGEFIKILDYLIKIGSIQI